MIKIIVDLTECVNDLKNQIFNVNVNQIFEYFRDLNIPLSLQLYNYKIGKIIFDYGYYIDKDTIRVHHFFNNDKSRLLIIEEVL